MTLTQTQEVPHRRARAVPSAVRDGQFTGALLIAGGVATPELGTALVPGPGQPGW